MLTRRKKCCFDVKTPFFPRRDVHPDAAKWGGGRQEGLQRSEGVLVFEDSQLCLEPCARHPRSPILSCSLADDILAYCQAQVATDLLDMDGVDAGGNDAGPSSPSSGALVSACVRTRKRRQSALDSACTECVHVGGGGSCLDPPRPPRALRKYSTSCQAACVVRTTDMAIGGMGGDRIPACIKASSHPCFTTCS